MKGYRVRRVWGWDCHGLPIENIVEKQLEISGKKQIEEKGVDVFNNACRSAVLTYASEWGKTVERIGRWVDFENSYKTMDTKYMESVWWAVKQIQEKGLLYEGRKVLLYCPRCETPVSNFEVAMDNSYKDVTEESVIVEFEVVKKSRSREVEKGRKEIELPVNTFILAWTTTPWTSWKCRAWLGRISIMFLQREEKNILFLEKIWWRRFSGTMLRLCAR